jgi:demethylmenaquinone methyltransferase/2-methoxy-6-polyprenyl-1,4-benzoquinol methylase
MADPGKKSKVTMMFNGIAHRYDFLNHFLSFGMDFIWRKKAIRKMGIQPGEQILDLATGTGDLAISSLKYAPAKIIGLDISYNMLHFGQKKLERRNLTDKISLICGDGENMPLRNGQFDHAMIAFGIRNMGNLPAALSELHRVLKDDGKLMILEFSTPDNTFFRKLYFFYFRIILPVLGRVISGHKEAYSYLPASVQNFPDRPTFIALLKETGFARVDTEIYTFGICTAYFCHK